MTCLSISASSTFFANAAVLLQHPGGKQVLHERPGTARTDVGADPTGIFAHERGAAWVAPPIVLKHLRHQLVRYPKRAVAIAIWADDVAFSHVRPLGVRASGALQVITLCKDGFATKLIAVVSHVIRGT